MVGYHLGGGLPLLGRTFGYAADRVRALDVVTADGQVRTLTPDDDLFRAMLGCRGAFGVVTSLVTEALPLTSVTGGGLWFTGDAIDPAVRAYLRWTADVPETVNSSVRIAHVRVAAVGDSSSSATWAARSPTAGPRSAAATPSTSSTPAARGSHALDVAFTAEDQAWLSRVKRAWDPDDLFRVAPFRVP